MSCKSDNYNDFSHISKRQHGRLAAVSRLSPKRLMAQLFCLMSLFIMVPAQAQMLIGFVDIPYLIDKAPQAIDAAKRLESEFAPREEKIKQLKQDLKQVQSLIRDQEESDDEERIKSLKLEAHKKERRLKLEEQEFREQLNIRKNSEFKKIRVIVLEAIAAFGKSKGYDLIVSDGVLYAKDSVDVTKKILQNLQRLAKSKKQP